MLNKVLLLSIKPDYVEKIFDGEKRVELRRTRPKVQRGDLIIVYATSPRKEIVGVLEVEKIEQKPLFELWEEVKEIAGISQEEFYSYYKGLTVGCGIFLNEHKYFNQPIKLDSLRKEWRGFNPPQSFRYLNNAEINFVASSTKFDINSFSTCRQLALGF